MPAPLLAGMSYIATPLHNFPAFLTAPLMYALLQQHSFNPSILF
jgi:hypothetical protein